MDSGIPRPKCDIEAGDQFVFIGNAPQTELRVITIGTVSVTGSLSLTIEMAPEPGQAKRNVDDLHSMPYSEALLMIEQGIWMERRRAEKMHFLIID